MEGYSKVESGRKIVYTGVSCTGKSTDLSRRFCPSIVQREQLTNELDLNIEINSPLGQGVYVAHKLLSLLNPKIRVYDRTFFDAIVYSAMFSNQPDSLRKCIRYIANCTEGASDDILDWKKFAFIMCLPKEECFPALVKNTIERDRCDVGVVMEMGVDYFKQQVKYFNILREELEEIGCTVVVVDELFNFSKIPNVQIC